MSSSTSVRLAFADSELQMERIDSPAGLTGLEAEWRKLWASLPDTTPFQSPDWLIPWWNSYGDGQLIAFAFRWRDALVGVAPLYIYNGDMRGVRRVFLMGTGNTDYLDVIIQPDFREICARLLLKDLLEQSDCWDTCDFQRLRPCSPLLTENLAAGFRAQRQQQDACPVLRRVHADTGKAMFKELAYYRRRMQRQHPFTIEQANDSSLEEIAAGLERLHGERWRAHGFAGVLNKEVDRDFHREVLRRFLRAGILRLYALRAGQEIVAVFYGFAHRSRAYFYLSGFDPALARLNLGSILLGHAIERSFAEGQDQFDFLSGEERYKYRWCAQNEWTYSMTVTK